MGLLSRGSAWLTAQLREKESEAVSITRGESTTTGVAAVPCPPSIILEESGEQVIQYEAWDFIIAAADYQIGAAVVMPQRGDKITRTIDGSPVYFDVMPTRDDPQSGYADAYQGRLRVRTKKAE